MCKNINENEENTTENNTKQYKIGKTTYNVSIFFSETSEETVEDKLKRLIETDPQILNS